MAFTIYLQKTKFLKLSSLLCPAPGIKRHLSVCLESSLEYLMILCYIVFGVMEWQLWMLRK